MTEVELTFAEANRVATAEQQAKEAADAAEKFAKEAEEKAAADALLAEQEAQKIAAEAGETRGKSLFELAGETKEPEEKPAVSAEIEVELAELKKLKEWAETNPLAKAAMLGVDPDGLKKIAKELAGEDYSKVGFEDLFRMEIKNKTSLEGESLEEALQTEISSLSPYQKAVKEEGLRKSFSGGISESQTLKAYEQQYLENQTKAAEGKIDWGKVAEIETSLLQETGKNFIAQGGELYGVKLDAAELEEIKKEYSVAAGSAYMDKTGKFNPGAFITQRFAVRNAEKIYESGKEAGRKEVLKEKSVGGNPPGQSAPNAVDTQTAEEKRLTERYTPDRLREMGYNEKGKKL